MLDHERSLGVFGTDCRRILFAGTSKKELDLIRSAN